MRATNLVAECDMTSPGFGCPPESKFEPVCDDGGSSKNLERLGLRRVGESGQITRSCMDGDLEHRLESPNRFGLVQNFYIYAATAKDCDTNPSAAGCVARAAIGGFDDIQSFDELRIVIPVSYSRIQLITADRSSGISEQEPRSLGDLAQSTIYVGDGVNAFHGAQIINTQKALNESLSAIVDDDAATPAEAENGVDPSEETASTDQQESENLLGKVAAIEALKNAIGRPELTEDDLPSGQKAFGNLLLACGIVDAYFISGELIPETSISLPAGSLPECLSNNSATRLSQVPIPENVIDMILSEHTYYQKISAPPEFTRLRNMLAVTTYLVTTADADAGVVERLTNALRSDWPYFMTVNASLAPLMDNIYEQPAPYHAGAFRALRRDGVFPLIEIHAGARTGAYRQVIDQLNHRARNFPPDCQLENADSGACLADFTFRAPCDDGGSLRNLERLGMSRLDGADTAVESCNLDSKARLLDGADKFALVQNFFVYGAAAAACKDKSAEQCTSKAAKEALRNYNYFPELRIVLPVSYSRIQVITSTSGADYNQDSNDEQNADQENNANDDPITALEDLAGQKIYLGTGVNATHGEEVLRRHPEIYSTLEENVISKPDALVSLREDFLRRQLLNIDEPAKSVLEDSLKNDARAFSEKEHERDAWKNDLIAESSIPDSKIEDVAARLSEFVALPQGHKALGNRLLACGIVKAYVISGEFINEEPIRPTTDTPEFCLSEASPQELRQVRIPEVIIQGMAQDHPYYRMVDAPRSLERDDMDSMPAVTTYLVTTAGTDEKLVADFTTALNSDWQNLMLLFDEFDFVDLVPLRENIYKQPAPYHSGAIDALRSANLLGQDFIDNPYVAAFWLFVGLVVLVFLTWKSEVRYDRLGESSQGELLSSLQWLIVPARIIFIIAASAFALTLVVITIRGLEMTEASGMGTDNPIASKGFEEVLLWMFTFVTSGFENDVFPQSTLSILIVSMFAVFGVAIPIWAIVSVIDRMRESRLARARGGEQRGWFKKWKDRAKELVPFSYRRQGMLLVCGWNDKAPGLVYTLTCPNSPFPGVVNIVADMDVEYPIEHFHFNKRRVRFYRGDASHRPTLERAEGLRADNALILADYNAGSSANTAGVLTALALRKLSEKRGDDIFVAAEMTLKEDDRRFSSAHVNDIVDPRLVTRQMLAVACFDEYVQDFVFDALSPDDHCEWYSVEAEKIRERFFHSNEKLTVRNYHRTLQRHGIVVVGICPKDPSEIGGLFCPDFKEEIYLDPLVTRESLDREVPDGSYIVCAAESPQVLRKPNSMGAFGSTDPGGEIQFSELSIIPPNPDSRSVLIIGHQDQVESLAEFMQASYSGVTFGTIATDQDGGDRLDNEISQNVADNSWTHVILLSSLPESHGSEEFKRYSRQADSETILRANLIRNALRQKGTDAVIVAEVNNTHSRQLARDAKVTTVVPSSLLVERMLARLVSGRGHVSEMLSAMLSVEDGTYLQSIVVTDEDPLNGKTFAEVINTWYADGRVLGMWPRQHESAYRNRSDDFGIHFAMCPSPGRRDLVIQPGDVLIALRFRTAGDDE